MGRVAIIGSTGQLGTDLVRFLGEVGGHQVFPLSRKEVECTDPHSVQGALKRVRPNLVVNCAAFVRVDDCEDRPEEAFRVNALGALYVARGCAEIEAICVHVSTDYVFDGEKETPYAEEDAPRPINVYGASKLAGETLVRQACPQSLIVRVASLFGKAGASGKGGNFIETILAKARARESLKVVNDIRITPTYTRDAAAVIVRLAEQGGPGVIHLTNSGVCTWHALAKTAVDLCRLGVSIEPVSSNAYPTRARRPRNSALDGTRAARLLGHPLPPWEDALARYLREKGYLG